MPNPRPLEREVPTEAKCKKDPPEDRESVEGCKGGVDQTSVVEDAKVRVE